MDKILVTGADGFIGSHLTEKLVLSGYNVRALVNYNSFNSWGWLDASSQEIKKNLDVYVGDIRDSNGVINATNGCDIVFHLAALIAIPFSYGHPESYVDTNIKGTLNILNAARKNDLQRVIHTSTSEVYGTAEYVPINEHHKLNGQSPYAASKIGADQIAMSYYYSFDTPVSIIRPFNTYGPRQSARAVIPTIITQILNGSKEIILGSTTPTRDFNFVDDIVNGFICALSSDNAIGEVINLGSNFEISIKETVLSISKIIGSEVKISSDKERIRPSKSEVDRLWADNSKAKNLLNWVPEYGNKKSFEKGLKHTIDWFSNPENIKMYKSNFYNK